MQSVKPQNVEKPVVDIRVIEAISPPLINVTPNIDKGQTPPAIVLDDNTSEAAMRKT